MDMISKHGPDVVLASGSPRRQEILQLLGLKFSVHVPEVDEEKMTAALEDAGPAEVAGALARAKCLAVGACYPDAVVIAADTIVTIDGRLLDKPESPRDAMNMLDLLRGRQHEVVTAVHVLDAGVDRGACATSLVSMAPSLNIRLEAYVATGEPFDKAGAYAVQGLGRNLVTCVDGCFLNVVGLPVCVLGRLLARLEQATAEDPPTVCGRLAAAIIGPRPMPFRVSPHPIT
jgi:septum formation protein